MLYDLADVVVVLYSVHHLFCSTRTTMK